MGSYCRKECCGVSLGHSQSPALFPTAFFTATITFSFLLLKSLSLLGAASDLSHRPEVRHSTIPFGARRLPPLSLIAACFINYPEILGQEGNGFFALVYLKKLEKSFFCLERILLITLGYPGSHVWLLGCFEMVCV